MKTPLIVDIETDGRPPQTGQLLCVGWQLADEDQTTVCAPPRVGDEGEYDLEWLALGAMLADPERPIVSMTKYDARYLRLQGWEVTGPYYDLQAMAWVLNENQTLSLDALARRYLGLQMDKRLRRSSGVLVFKCDDGRPVPMEGIAEDPVAFAQMAAYCGRDVEAETRLFNTLWETLETTAWLDYFLEEEAPFTATLLDMECSGLPVNLVDSEALRARLEVEAEDARHSLLSSASLPPGTNVDSPTQLSAYLYGQVFELWAYLDWGAEAVECLKSCLAGEHEDCDEAFYLPGYDGVHIVDLLPDRFSIDSVGRTKVNGRYTMKGRNLPPTIKTPKGDRWSSSSPALRANLSAMQDPWVVELLRYRQVQKVLTTYLRRFPEQAQGGATRLLEVQPDGSGPASERVLPRLYGRFNQTGTKTGRLSSSEPNLQNIPARGDLGESVRGLFQGDLVVGDYSQLEPRLLAHYSQDPVLLDVYRSGKDIYNVTGSAIFGVQVEKGMRERDISKVVFLGDQYGMGDTKLAATLTMNGFPTLPPEAKAYQQELHGLYAIAEAWKDGVRRAVKQKGYVVTIGGRHRRLKAAFVDRRNWKNVGYGERQAVNAIIQGSAGDVVRRVMVRGLWQHEQTLLAQVHDELVWQWAADYPPSEHQLKYIQHVGETAHGFDLSLPLVFEPHFGHSWFSAKEGTIELPDDTVEETEGYEEL